MKENLILYYAHEGNESHSFVDEEVPFDHPLIAAQYIQQAVGGDLIKIDTVAPYHHDFMTHLQEEEHESMPELKSVIDNAENYSNVFICAPCWYGTYPTPVLVQLEKLEWNGKTVLPFVSHEGSGMAHSMSDVKERCSGANVKEGLAIYQTHMQDHKEQIQQWAMHGIQ
jgi:flavodoxin